MQQPKAVIVTTRKDDLLTLFTRFKEDERGEYVPSKTRSAILNRGNGGDQWFLIDHIPFVLFISMHSSIPIEALRLFMLHSYANLQYISPYKNRKDNNDEETYKKGLLSRVEENHNVSDDIKGMLENIDERNTRNMRRFMEMRYKKKKKGSDESDEEEEEERSSFEEDDFDIATGYERPEDAHERKKAGIDHDEDGEEDEPFFMPLPKTASASVPPGFENDHQYRIVFKNHTILHYFVNRFMHKTVDIKSVDATDVHIKVLAYEHDVAGKCRLRPLYKLFKDNAILYVENQLYNYKKNAATQHSYSFPLKESSAPLEIGLLHPSHCDRNQQSIHLFVRNQPSQIEATLKPLCGGNQRDKIDRGLSYQTLYIDFADILENEQYAKEIIRVKFNERKFSLFKPQVTTKKKNHSVSKKAGFDPNKLFFCLDDEEEEEEVVEGDEEIVVQPLKKSAPVEWKEDPNRIPVSGKAVKKSHGPRKPKDSSITLFTQKMPPRDESTNVPFFLQRSPVIVTTKKKKSVSPIVNKKKRLASQTSSSGPMDLFTSKKQRA